MDNLPVQVAKLHFVRVDDADPADTRRGKIQKRRRSQSACAHDQYACAFQPGLSCRPDLRHADLPLKAKVVFIGEIVIIGKVRYI
jgi:hypothetical protein